MTTTIRPSGPETATPGGGRRRAYAVCVNGRVVGGLTVAADGGAGARGGTVSELVIDRRDRGRGRGIVAGLAAEEVLRAWGCTSANAWVPAGTGEEAGLGLARTLGYTLRSANLRKALPALPPALPAGSAGRPMRDDEYRPWLAAESWNHVAALVAHGLTSAQAEARTAASHAAVLPDGPASPDTLLRVLEADGEPVGSVWVHTRQRTLPDGSPLAWVFDIVVDQARRGRGHGRTLMLLAERECLAHDVHHLGLNVFADNRTARSLYASLGYVPYRHVLHKQL
ncbi:GNAT family N-acetyltransferase [Streptacidiphilus cavernicola]|uniref:N-acetyltransferase family protein n=1 Tax=Streptacidiphilus cavernicola TaxID=3342716 RepID=A0ABV6VQC6_9ACTN